MANPSLVVMMVKIHSLFCMLTLLIVLVSLLSGWNDGCIRAFTPQSGKLIYTIPNAHNKGVTALDLTSDGSTIVSGGGEGQVCEQIY